MQAIQTKYIPATNHKPSRIKAWCERGSITVSYDYELGDEGAAQVAVNALVSRFAEQDRKNYGTPVEGNPWLRPMACGGLPSGGYAFVFIPTNK
jgi:hypothetical protein